MNQNLFILFKIYHSGEVLYFFADDSFEVRGLLDEMMQQINELNESLAREKQRIDKMEGALVHGWNMEKKVM